jgi:prepilin-type N-terminal cleavage/methylation domain-containing protein
MILARLKKNEKGFTLIEVLVALAITGLVVVAFLTAMSVASKANIITNERTTAESLARSQMEYVKSLPFDGSYDPLVPQDYLDAGYTVPPIDVAERQTGLQKITVIVQHHGNDVLTLEDYKVDR